VNKKVVAISIPLLFVIALLSGCIGNQETEQTTPITQNNPPTAAISISGIIDPPPSYIDLTAITAVAYAGDTITFDASASHDPDGDIVLYKWIWEDNTDTEGITATRQFNIDNVFDLHGLPLIFSVILQVEDNNQSPDILDYRIGIIPKDHTLYFDSKELNLQKPGAGKSTIKIAMGKLRPIEELKYALNEPLCIQSCAWNVTLSIEKPLFALINKISIILYNDEGKEIARTDEQLGLMTLWMEKAIQLKGSVDTKEEFESLTVIIYGFSLRGNINVLYGGERASHLFFDFTA
jgi:hypothetical protein